MLQQTQVHRVSLFYRNFVRTFPTPHALAKAPLQKILLKWRGLGYNRRALFLRQAAEIIVRDCEGKVPRNAETLVALPGIGPATAAAIGAYAWDEPVVFIETNIRTVFLHFFFKRRRQITDKEVLKLVEQTLPRKVQLLSRSKVEPLGVREWYYALMDYGTMLKKTFGSLNARSAHYAKQSSFKGSRRELRGEILRRVISRPIQISNLPSLEKKGIRVAAVFSELVSEGFLQKRGKDFVLAV